MSSTSMARSSIPVPPELPQEIINNILSKFDDDPFLWVVCRQISKTFCKEIEFLFQQTRFQETSLNLQWYCSTFSHVSTYGQTAYFKTHFISIIAPSSYSTWSSEPGNWAHFKSILDQDIAAAGLYEADDDTHAHVSMRIRTAPLPSSNIRERHRASRSHTTRRHR
jgi:hypothetical protein